MLVINESSDNVCKAKAGLKLGYNFEELINKTKCVINVKGRHACIFLLLPIRVSFLF